MSDIRDERHWIDETYKQRITTKQWRKILIEDGDSIICRGKIRHLKAKNLGAGVVEISKSKRSD